jgi:hypothetical protein
MSDRIDEPRKTQQISWEAFEKAPREFVARFVPQTVIYSMGGTRRAAALARVPSDQYAAWSYERTIECCSLLFAHGVKHLVAPVLIQTAWREKTPDYREKLMHWMQHFLAGDAAIERYQKLGWRVRVVADMRVPEFREMADRLRDGTVGQSAPVLWFVFAPDVSLVWEVLLSTMQNANARTQSEAVRAVFGEDVPPAGMFLSWGKPMLGADFFPFLLLDQYTHCYWLQRPGYSLTESELRKIVFDCAITRSTWREDKSGRAQSALAQPSLWEQAPTVGLGTRVGPFWYPAPIAPVGQLPARAREQ